MQCTSRKIRFRVDTEMTEGDQDSTIREVYKLGAGKKLSIFIHFTHEMLSFIIGYCDI